MAQAGYILRSVAVLRYSRMQFRSLYLTTNRANYCCNRHFAAFQAFPVTQPLTSAILSSEIRISCPAVTSSLQVTFQLYRPETFKMCNVGGRSGSKYFYYKALVDFAATEYSVVITSHSACSERLRQLSRSPRLRLKKFSVSPPTTLELPPST